jgi:predicted metalloendopeptidase
VDSGKLGLPSAYYLNPKLRNDVLGVYRDLIVDVAKTFRRETQGAKVPTKRMIQDAEEIINFETRMAQVSTILTNGEVKRKRNRCFV